MDRTRAMYLSLASAAILLIAGVSLLKGRHAPSFSERAKRAGERAAERYPPEFPAEALAAGLVREPVELPRQGHRRVDFTGFTPWFDGRPRFVYGWTGKDNVFGLPRRWRLVHGSLGTFEEQALDTRIFGLELAVTPRGTNQLVVLADDADIAVFPTLVAARSESGERLWAFDSPEHSVKDFAILHDDDGPYGVAVGVGGETGIVTVDFEGRAIWEFPKDYVLYELRTHASLPGHLLEVSGEFVFLEHSRRGLVQVRSSRDRPFGKRRLHGYLHHGLLIPDGAARPAAVVAGFRRPDKRPRIMRCDHQFASVWEARTDSMVAALALVEAEGHPRLIVATTRAGTLLVLDEDGTLRWSGAMPNPRDSKYVATYSLSAGPLGEGRWAIAVRLLWGSYVYELDLGALDAAPPK